MDGQTLGTSDNLTGRAGDLQQSSGAPQTPAPAGAVGDTGAPNTNGDGWWDSMQRAARHARLLAGRDDT